MRDPAPWWAPLRVLGVLLLVAGVALLVHAFARFVMEGLGTPMPAAPPSRLVVGGPYRYLPNPMYVAIISADIGQALLFGDLWLLVVAILFWICVAAFVGLYEEPALRRRLGADYDQYRRNVPAWWPRLRPWRQ